MKKEMTITFHGTPDTSRIATALSIILSQKYKADVTVRIKADVTDELNKNTFYITKEKASTRCERTEA